MNYLVAAIGLGSPNIFDQMERLRMNRTNNDGSAVTENDILRIMKSSNFNPKQLNKNGTTILLIACTFELNNVALEMIHNYDPMADAKNSYNCTALMHACCSSNSDMELVALEIIKTNKSNPSAVCRTNRLTALHLACKNNMKSAALAIIETNDSNPGQVNNEKETALLVACQNRMESVALAIIETNDSNPGQVSDIKQTALLVACYNRMESVALAIIETYDSNPGQVCCYAGNTALLVACRNNMESVAIALLDTCLANPAHKDHLALVYASKMKMTKVYTALLKIKNYGYESYFIEEKDDA